jgi:hypothetical protein
MDPPKSSVERFFEDLDDSDRMLVRSLIYITGGAVALYAGSVVLTAYGVAELVGMDLAIATYSAVKYTVGVHSLAAGTATFGAWSALKWGDTSDNRDSTEQAIHAVRDPFSAIGKALGHQGDHQTKDGYSSYLKNIRKGEAPYQIGQAIGNSISDIGDKLGTRRVREPVAETRASRHADVKPLEIRVRGMRIEGRDPSARENQRGNNSSGDTRGDRSGSQSKDRGATNSKNGGSNSGDGGQKPVTVPAKP